MFRLIAKLQLIICSKSNYIIFKQTLLKWKKHKHYLYLLKYNVNQFWKALRGELINKLYCIVIVLIVLYIIASSVIWVGCFVLLLIKMHIICWFQIIACTQTDHSFELENKIVKCISKTGCKKKYIGNRSIKLISIDGNISMIIRSKSNVFPVK